jgi:ankyrin repeat protein
MLLDAGADMERARPNGDRPLHIALLNERDDVAALLLRHGADATVRTVKNDTPLHIAVANAHLLSTLILLDKGVSTEDINEDIHTPLCCSLSPAITKLLIERGANIHYADADNWTPLHQAVFNSDLETCAALLRAGADVYVRTTDDGLNIIERAMDIVDEGTRDSFLRLLMGAEEGV